MKTQRRAFTLVELLVVIGIIAVLISILLPALRRAQEAAQRTLCMSNHKQFATALFLYAGDNKGATPNCNWGQPPAGGVGWMYDSAMIGAAGNFNWNDDTKNMVTGTFWKYLRVKKVYRCPFDMEPYHNGTTGALGWVHEITSYGMNGSVMGYYSGGVPHYFKLSDFKSADIVIWELNEDFNRISGSATSIWNDASNFPYEGITTRHGSRSLAKGAGGIVTTFGGNVEWITASEYYKEALVADPNRPTAPGSYKRTRLYNIPKKYSRNGRTMP